jgi:hypothetical protein
MLVGPGPRPQGSQRSTVSPHRIGSWPPMRSSLPVCRSDAPLTRVGGAVTLARQSQSSARDHARRRARSARWPRCRQTVSWAPSSPRWRSRAHVLPFVDAHVGTLAPGLWLDRAVPEGRPQRVTGGRAAWWSRSRCSRDGGRPAAAGTGGRRIGGRHRPAAPGTSSAAGRGRHLDGPAESAPVLFVGFTFEVDHVFDRSCRPGYRNERSVGRGGPGEGRPVRSELVSPRSLMRARPRTRGSHRPECQ